MLMCKPDHRGGQPARGLLTGGKTREDAVGGIQRGGAGFRPASGQRDCGADQVRRRLGPDLPWVISSVIRGRDTAQLGTPGAMILAARIGTPADPADVLARPATRLVT